MLVAAFVSVTAWSLAIPAYAGISLFQAWNGFQQLHLVVFFHGIGNTIRVDNIAVQALGLKPYMVSAVGKPLKFSFQ